MLVQMYARRCCRCGKNQTDWKHSATAAAKDAQRLGWRRLRKIERSSNGSRKLYGKELDDVCPACLQEHLDEIKEIQASPRVVRWGKLNLYLPREESAKPAEAAS